MEKISCEIISDLLPLYCDDVCTNDSRSLIESHLKDCCKCRLLAEKLHTDCRLLKEQESREEALFKNMADAWKKSIWKSFFKGLLAASCSFLLLTAGYFGLTRWPIQPVPSHGVTAEASISGTDFIVHIMETDGYKSTSVDFHTTEDGKMYICLKRGIIPVKTGSGTSFGGTFSDSLNTVSESGKPVLINEIYYGTKDDHRLLWKRR